jgi:hypothetical protein
LLVDEATSRFVTGADRTALRHVLGRAFAHAAMKDAADGFARGTVSGKLLPALAGASLQPELISVAAAFVELQQARHEADYDTARRFTRQECLDLVDQAEKAFAHWKTARQTLQADTFLVALLALRQMRS